MCGRYSLASVDPAQLRDRFPLSEQIEIPPRYNIAPGDDVLGVTLDKAGSPRLELLRWGLVPSWAESSQPRGRLINARAETVAERPAFRESFKARRCLIPADGFYEWRSGPGRTKEAFHIARRGGGMFMFAGLWSVWRPEADAHSHELPLRSCAIITTQANAAIRPLHDRMPVILPAAAEEIWLDGGTPHSVLSSLLVPLPAQDTVARAVGPAVNDVRCDAPECLADPTPGHGRQTALF